MSPAERIGLQTSYSRYRTVETLLRITLEERNTLLPEGPRLDLLARCLGVSSGAELRTELAEAMRATRRKFLEISRRLTA
jgi:glutamine synthetase adenylyltransferase